jgi:3-oxoacyl-[acyl-carrier protein] reductase
MRLKKGEVAVITGGSRGIGAAVAKTLSREGALVVIDYVQNASAAQRVADEIKASGGTAICVQVDVSEKKSAQHLIDETIRAFGRIDILVNNAGVLTMGTILDTEERIWDRTMAVNLKGPFNCMQAAAKVMVERRSGRIVNISSVNGLGMAAAKDEIAYSTSKAALVAMTQLAAAELGQHGVRANCVAPGFIMTDMALQSAGSEEKLRELKKLKAGLASLGRVGDPQDIADVVLFLVTDESRFINGQVIVVDGLRRDFFSHG